MIMRARRIKREYDAGGNVLRRDLVFFGSYGLNSDGTAKFFNEDDKHDSFSEGKEGVADALLFKLNILEGEIWRNVNYGWPLWDKHKSKFTLDAHLSSIILNQVGVMRIDKFYSKIVRNDEFKFSTYVANVLIVTEFGELEFNMEQNV